MARTRRCHEACARSRGKSQAFPPLKEAGRPGMSQLKEGVGSKAPTPFVNPARLPASVLTDRQAAWALRLDM